MTNTDRIVKVCVRECLNVGGELLVWGVFVFC